jgi:hypothetical protein
VTLKNVWHKAICSEYFKLLYGALNAASIPTDTKLSVDRVDQISQLPVTVVPIFEPRVSGKTRSIVTRPKPTRGVSVLVKTDEL